MQLQILTNHAHWSLLKQWLLELIFASNNLPKRNINLVSSKFGNWAENMDCNFMFQITRESLPVYQTLHEDQAMDIRIPPGSSINRTVYILRQVISTSGWNGTGRVILDRADLSEVNSWWINPASDDAVDQVCVEQPSTAHCATDVAELDCCMVPYFHAGWQRLQKNGFGVKPKVLAGG